MVGYINKLHKRTGESFLYWYVVYLSRSFCTSQHRKILTIITELVESPRCFYRCRNGGYYISQYLDMTANPRHTNQWNIKMKHLWTRSKVLSKQNIVTRNWYQVKFMIYLSTFPFDDISHCIKSAYFWIRVLITRFSPR